MDAYEHRPPASAPAEHPMLAWAKENLARGCDANDLMRTMLSSSWGWRDAAAFLAQASAEAGLAELRSWTPAPRAELFAGADASGPRVASWIADPKVALVAGFMSAEERAGLIELATAKLSRSMTVGVEDASAQAVHPDRTSSGAHLTDNAHPLIAKLRARCAWAFECPEPNIEGLQVLRYLPGQEYKPHQDWFDPALSGAGAQLARGGQRVATFVTYLNDCPLGGATFFPALGFRSAPVAGNGIFFAYACDKDKASDARLLHGGDPVEEGEKWVCTFWMRQAAFR